MWLFVTADPRSRAACGILGSCNLSHAPVHGLFDLIEWLGTIKDPEFHTATTTQSCRFRRLWLIVLTYSHSHILLPLSNKRDSVCPFNKRISSISYKSSRCKFIFHCHDSSIRFILAPNDNTQQQTSTWLDERASGRCSAAPSQPGTPSVRR